MPDLVKRPCSVNGASVDIPQIEAGMRLDVIGDDDEAGGYLGMWRRVRDGRRSPVVGLA